MVQLPLPGLGTTEGCALREDERVLLICRFGAAAIGIGSGWVV